MSFAFSQWDRFQRYFVRYDDLGFSIDISRMNFADELFDKMSAGTAKAHEAMKALEAGAMANPDEKRMVGHYWLRKPELAPEPEMRAEITGTLDATLGFAADVIAGKIVTDC
jgi:glucose-6-phosphate isomerase